MQWSTVRARPKAPIVLALALVAAASALVGAPSSAAAVRNARVTVSPGQIATVAGGGTCTSDVDAIRTCLTPFGVAVGPNGNVYVSDFRHRVRMLAPDGRLTLVAGGGPIGPACGDGGPAVGACLNAPTGLAFDHAGNLYIADQGDDRVRKVDTAGTISTVAGKANRHFCGDGGPATDACLSSPTGVAVGADGSLYIADTGNNRVRVVDPAGIISTYAGSDATKFCGDGGPATDACLKAPAAVAIAADGSVLIADTTHNRIRRVDRAGTITTLAGNGAAGSCRDGRPPAHTCISVPGAVTVDPSGNVYIAERGTNRIRKIDPSGVVSTVAGNGPSSYCGDHGPATFACLNGPAGLAVTRGGALYVGDFNNGRLREINRAGTIRTVAGNGTGLYGSDGSCGDGGAATVACLDAPNAVALGGGGRVYIAESDSERIRRVNADGTITTIAGEGTPNTFCGDGGPAIDACFHMGIDFPTSDGGALAVSGRRDIYVADTFNNRVRLITPNGAITTVAGNGSPSTCGDGGPALDACVFEPTGVAVDRAGNLYIATQFEVRKVATDGTISDFAGSNSHYGFCGDGGPAVDACFNEIEGIALDSSGNLFVADSENFAIRKIDTAGIVTTVAGGFRSTCGPDGGPAVDACLSDPTAVAVHGGNLYLTDIGTDLVSMVDRAGNIHTIAGSTDGGFCGDGGPATSACLDRPVSLAVDSSGNVFVADSLNERIREIGAP